MRRRGGIILIGACTLVAALYAAVGFWWVPRFVRTAVLETFERDYHRVATLDSARFNPFSFEFEARGFSLPDGDGERLLGFDRLYVNFGLVSIWHRAWTFDAISLEQPYLRVVQRADGRLNLADLRSARAEPPAGERAALPSLRIGELSVSGGQVDVLDQQRAEPFATTLRPVSFALTDFESRGDGNAFSLTAGSDRAGRLALDGRFDTQPLASRGTLKVSGLPATTVTEYLRDALPVALRAGTLDLDVAFDFSLADDPYRLALVLPTARASGLETVARGHEIAWTWPAIELKDAKIDVAARRVGIGAIGVRSPAMPVWIDAGGFQAPGAVFLNLPPENTPAGAPALPGPAPAGPEPAPAQAPPPASGPRWQIAIASMTAADAVIPFEDRRPAVPVPLALTLREMRIGNFTWPQSAPFTLAARVESAGGGAVAFDGTMSIDPVAVAGEVSTEALDLRPAQGWLDADTDLELKGGTLTSRGRFEYGQAARPQLRYAGDASIAGLRTLDGAQGRDFVNWSALELRRIELTRAPARLAIREVVASDAYLRLIIAENGVTNLLAVLDPAEAARRAAEIAAERAAQAAGQGRKDEEVEEEDAPDAGAAAAPPPVEARMPMRIGAVRIRNGNVNFSDYTLQPNFEIAVERLNGSVSGMTSEATQRARLELAGEVDRYAPARIDGDINLLAARSFLDIAASFRNIELTTFNPYSGKFAGYRIDKGKLTIETNYRVENRRLVADHHFIIDQLQLGERVESPDAVSLPLRLAVALLKDRNGVIDVDLPVTGTLDDPQFRLGPIIWKAVVRLLVKIVASPFKLIGGLFGGGADLSEVRFAPGSAALDAATGERLGALKKALVERPGLSIDIPTAIDPAADRAAIEEARWIALTAGFDGADRKAWLDALTRLHRERLGGPPQIPKPPKPAEGQPEVDRVEHAIGIVEPALRASVTADEPALAALGQSRAEAVRDVLLGDGAVDPARVFIIRGDPAAAADGAVRMVLTLK